MAASSCLPAGTRQRPSIGGNPVPPRCTVIASTWLPFMNNAKCTGGGDMATPSFSSSGRRSTERTRIS